MVQIVTDIVGDKMWWVGERRWRNGAAPRKAVNPMNFTRWKHLWDHHNRGIVWDTAVTRWAGKEEWVTKKKNAEEKEQNQER